MLNHINLLMECSRQIICQYLVLFVLAVVATKIVTKKTWSEVGVLFYKYALPVALIMLVLYIIWPIKMTGIINNINIVIGLNIVVLAFLKDVATRLTGLSGIIGSSFDFWIEVLKNPIRLCCFVITVWYFAKGSIGDAVAVFVFFCVGTVLLVEKLRVDTIDWSDPFNQILATLVAILIAIGTIALLLSPTGIIGKIIVGILSVVAFIIGALVIFLFAKKLSEK